MVLSVRWHVASSRSLNIYKVHLTPRPAVCPWPVGITLAVGSPTFTTPSLGSTPGRHLYTWPTPQQTAVYPSVRLTARAQNATVLNTADVGDAWLILINTIVGQQGVAANQGNHCTMDPVTATVGRSLKTTKSTLGTTVSRGVLTMAPTSSQRLSGLELTARERRHSETRPACCGHRYRTETSRICPAFVLSGQDATRMCQLLHQPALTPTRRRLWLRGRRLLEHTNVSRAVNTSAILPHSRRSDSNRTSPSGLDWRSEQRLGIRQKQRKKAAFPHKTSRHCPVCRRETTEEAAPRLTESFSEAFQFHGGLTTLARQQDNRQHAPFT